MHIYTLCAQKGSRDPFETHHSLLPNDLLLPIRLRGSLPDLTYFQPKLSPDLGLRELLRRKAIVIDWRTNLDCGTIHSRCLDPPDGNLLRYVIYNNGRCRSAIITSGHRPIHIWSQQPAPSRNCSTHLNRSCPAVSQSWRRIQYPLLGACPAISNRPVISPSFLQV
jgi:hypothetical protein